MKTMNNFCKAWVILIPMLLLFLLSCNKEDLDFEKVIQVKLSIYNGSDVDWRIAIDTADQSLVRANEASSYLTVHRYRNNQPKGTLIVKEEASKKEIFNQEIITEGISAFYSVISINNKLLSVPSDIDESKNKLSFYITVPNREDLFDLVIYYRDPTYGHIQQYYLAKNLKPNAWNTIDDGELLKQPLANLLLKNGLQMRFLKANTTNFYFESDWKSNVELSQLFFPKATEKGKHKAYFFKPTSGTLTLLRLFDPTVTF